jgi:hypothetical protein
MQSEKGEKNNGTCKESKKSKSMGQAEMENEVWQEVFGDWGKIFARESYQSNVSFGICKDNGSEKKR